MKLKKILKKLHIQKNNKTYEKAIKKYSLKIINAVNSTGENLIAFGTTEILSGENITIGNNCKINSDVLLNGRSGIVIGDNVTLSHGAKIVSTGYDIEKWMTIGERVHISDKPIYIGNNCWIGVNAIILPGVKIIGEYVVIGAGAVVTKDITENKVVVAGVPAKIIKRLGETN